jgi:hypothetical protein
MYIHGPLECVKPPRGASTKDICKWLEGVVLDSRERILIIDAGKGVHTSHFSQPSNYEVVKQAFGFLAFNGTMAQRPTKARQVPAPSKRAKHGAGRMAELRTRGLVRAAAPNTTAVHAAQFAVKVLRESAPPPVDWWDAEYVEPELAADPPIVEKTKAAIHNPSMVCKSIWEQLENEDNCWWYTGEESFKLLQFMFAYINADGAFDTLRSFRKGRKARDRGQGGAATKLTPFEQFVFWRVVFKRFRGRGQIRHGGYLFGLEPRTADRLYITWTQAMGRFFDGQQPPATLAQAYAATSAKTIGNLGLKRGEAVFLGDCTERWITDPGDGALHSVFYSEYKSHTTIKYLTISTGSSYLQHVPRPFVGACTDNGAHAIAGVSKLFCKN